MRKKYLSFATTLTDCGASLQLPLLLGNNFFSSSTSSPPPSPSPSPPPTPPPPPPHPFPPTPSSPPPLPPPTALFILLLIHIFDVLGNCSFLPLLRWKGFSSNIKFQLFFNLHAITTISIYLSIKSQVTKLALQTEDVIRIRNVMKNTMRNTVRNTVRNVMRNTTRSTIYTLGHEMQQGMEHVMKNTKPVLKIPVLANCAYPCL